jgi:hypothetical protein
MKNTLSHTVTAALLCGLGLQVHGQPAPAPTATQPTTSPGAAMTRAEKIRQLKPATNHVELMQLLKTLHDEVLLLDPSFIEDGNILRLFGSGTIKVTEYPNDSSFLAKTLIPDARNPTGFHVLVTSARGFGTLRIGTGSFPLRAIPGFNHELVETYLMPGEQGLDPLGPTQPLTNEARNYAGSRALATHPKGYFAYSRYQRTTELDNYTRVDLNRNAEIESIGLEQQEIKK